ncbi:gluconokinase [uncultured Lacinutrix sp.]|uniref:gluconokinase n=1 Tax=uncultured Lacinutrix sp. TaxID=574032 RepID=UPI0026391C88|nr:gluconokinase [uncultured Lacinutrix sp.]
MIIIVMGVSGCGKTTIGMQLALELGFDYYDADDFHPQSNIDKMQRGKALNDVDRKPWLTSLSQKLSSWEDDNGVVLACSALKESYRRILASNVSNIHWVYLQGAFNTIESRIKKRAGHFMKSNLLESQFNALEEPNYGLYVNIENKPLDIIQIIISKIKK